MKKTAIIMVAVLAVVLSIVCLTACADNAMDGSDSVTEGTYKFYSMRYEDEVWNIGDTDEEGSLGLLTADSVVLVLNADGTINFTMGAEGDFRIGGTWKQEANTVTIKFETEDVAVFIKKGDKLTGGLIGSLYFDLKKSR